MSRTNFKGALPVKCGGGFTLLELVIVMLIVAVVVGGALPSLAQSIRNNQVSSQNMSLIAILNFSRSEAIRRGVPVTMVMTADGNNWQAIVEDPNNEADIEGCVLGQLRCTTNTGVALAIDSTQLIFNSRGYIRDSEDAWTPETMFMQHQHCIGQNQRRRIDITPTGQVSSCSLPCDSTAICP